MNDLLVTGVAGCNKNMYLQRTVVSIIVYWYSREDYIVELVTIKIFLFE